MPTGRLYFLDNLKWFIIWLMVVFHGAAMCYMAYAPDWWYVVDKANPVLSATLFVCWADIFIMPVMTYIILASRQAAMGFWEFYTTLFWGPFYQQAQYWYLGALLALYVLLMIAVRIFPSLSEQRAGKPGAGLFAVMFLLAAVSIGLISSHMHPDTWRFFAYILVLQPVRIPLYIMVFFTGAWAWRQKWFAAGGYVPGPGKWGTAFLLTGGIYLWQKFVLPVLGWDAGTMVWLNAVTMGAFALSSLFFLLGFFHMYFNHAGRRLAVLGGTSYGVYYLHMPVLFPVAWAFVGGT